MAIASRTAVDGPAGVVLPKVGVLGLEVVDTLEVCRECRLGDKGVTGVVLRNVLTGVIGLFLTGLNEDVVVTRGFDTEDGPVAPAPRCVLPGGTLLVFLPGGGFFTESSCRSLASRMLSFVRPARLNDGVCRGIALAVGGVLIPANSFAVPKLMFC